MQTNMTSNRNSGTVNKSMRGQTHIFAAADKVMRSVHIAQIKIWLTYLLVFILH